MYRIFFEGKVRKDFLTYAEFCEWRKAAAREGIEARYAFAVRVRVGDYIYCYQARRRDTK